jgi:hypothetical protein
MIEIVGGVLIAVAYCAGWATARHRAKGSPAEICQCSHGSAYHDATGCHVSIEKGAVTHYRYDGVAIAWRPANCACVRYVGPLSSYIPELDGHTKEIQ